MFDAKIIKDKLIIWIREYFENNASPETKAVIGISGGKDSSVVAALCVEALGKDRVIGVLIPQGDQYDIDIAYDLCKFLNIKYYEINIEKTVNSLYEGITGSGLELNNIATFNSPARIRMSVLYAVSGIVGGRVANTCNLSEDWVGYSTKFGDSAGDFSPLSNLTVTEVKEIGRVLALPEIFIEKVPIDGLCGKTDEENLGFTYDVLDKYIRGKICDDEGIKEKIDKLHKQNLHKINPMPMFEMELMESDFYLNSSNVYNRLLQEYNQYGKLIIAYDFDDTVYDFHKKGRTYDNVVELLRLWKNHAELIVLSCIDRNDAERIKFTKQYLIDNNIPFDKINEQSKNSPAPNADKIYYNVLLDDRAGLKENYDILLKLIKHISSVF